MFVKCKQISFSKTQLLHQYLELGKQATNDRVHQQANCERRRAYLLMADLCSYDVAHRGHHWVDEHKDA